MLPGRGGDAAAAESIAGGDGARDAAALGEGEGATENGISATPGNEEGEGLPDSPATLVTGIAPGIPCLAIPAIPRID